MRGANKWLHTCTCRASAAVPEHARAPRRALRRAQPSIEREQPPVTLLTVVESAAVLLLADNSNTYIHAGAAAPEIQILPHW